MFTDSRHRWILLVGILLSVGALLMPPWKVGNEIEFGFLFSGRNREISVLVLLVELCIILLLSIGAIVLGDLMRNRINKRQLLLIIDFIFVALLIVTITICWVQIKDRKISNELWANIQATTNTKFLDMQSNVSYNMARLKVMQEINEQYILNTQSEEFLNGFNILFNKEWNDFRSSHYENEKE